MAIKNEELEKTPKKLKFPETIKIYNYDPVTFEYTGESDARQDPRDPGHYMIPAFATDIQPPKVKRNEKAIFLMEANRWEVIKDYRNMEIFSKETGEPVKIETIGELPKYLTTIKKPGNEYIWDEEKNEWVKDKVKEKEIKLQKLFEDFYNKKYRPIKFNEFEFNADPNFRNDLALGIAAGENLYLFDTSNDIVIISLEDAKKLAKDIARRDKQFIKSLESKIEKLDQ